MTVEPIERDILGITIKCINWSLEVNDYVLCYQTPKDYGYDEDIIEGLDISKDIYYLRIYPHTPVGFVDFGANSIEELQDKLQAWKSE